MSVKEGCLPVAHKPKAIDRLPLRDLQKTSTGLSHQYLAPFSEPGLAESSCGRPFPPKLLKKSAEVCSDDHFASTAQTSFNRKSLVEYSRGDQKYPLPPSCTDVHYLRPYCDSFKNVPRAAYRIDFPASDIKTEYLDKYQGSEDNIWFHPSLLSTNEILQNQPEPVRDGLSLPKPILGLPVQDRTLADELDFSRSTTQKDHKYFPPKLLREELYQKNAVTVWNSREGLFADKWRSSVKPHHMHLKNIMADRKKQPMTDKHWPQLSDGKRPTAQPLAGSGKSEMQEAYLPKNHDMTDHFFYPECPEELHDSGYRSDGIKEIVPKMYETISSSIGSPDILIL